MQDITFGPINRLPHIFRKIQCKTGKKEDHSSFGSVANTILHLTWAEYLWTLRINENPSGSQDLSRSGGKELLIKNFIDCSKQFNALVISYDEVALDQFVTYTTMSGNSYRNKRYEMIHHCINHSTYHRGQLILMMRNVGIQKVPSTDYITYLNMYKVES